MKPTLHITEDLPALRQVFTAAEYGIAKMVGIFGPVSLPTAASGDLPYFLHLTREPSPLNTLVRLFLLGVAVDEDAAVAAFAPTPISAWERAGLVQRSAGQVRGSVRLLDFRGLLVATDYLEMLGEDRGELVMGITESTALLADFAVPRRSRRTLDLGTGGGIIAFLAAAYSDFTVGTDLSERAVEFARFNAAFNRISGVEFLAGNAFEPVQGQRFDLILSNPPFVILPGKRYTYRDSGSDGDDFCRQLLRTGPEFLNEGGFLQITGSWVHTTGQDWKDRIAEWVEGTGCDAWVLGLQTLTPPVYARNWIRDTEYGSQEEKCRLFDEWMAYYAARGIEAISTGMIALRRRSGRNWSRIEDTADATTGAGPLGSSVQTGFLLRDWLDATDDATLLETRLLTNPSLRLEQECQATGGTWCITSLEVRLTEGVRYSGNIDQRTAALVARCDGSRTVRELIEHLASSVGAAPDRVAASVLALVRQLLSRGYILPEGLTPGA